jgi:hypothetical protein
MGNQEFRLRRISEQDTIPKPGGLGLRWPAQTPNTCPPRTHHVGHSVGMCWVRGG